MRRTTLNTQKLNIHVKFLEMKMIAYVALPHELQGADLLSWIDTHTIRDADNPLCLDIWKVMGSNVLRLIENIAVSPAAISMTPLQREN